MSDGTYRWFFCGDLDAYQRAIASGRYPFQATFAQNPPRVAGEPTTE
jgi:hypothetical protein